MKNDKTRKLVLAALFAALCCVATMLIKIPSPLKGYLNLGDCAVLVSGWTLGGVYGFLAAAIGSALADVFSGYVFYAPATFVIKGLVALVAYLLYKKIRLKNDTVSKLLSALGAEIVMAVGYYVFEGFMYGFGAALVNVTSNLIQGAAGIVLGIILERILDKTEK